jgi:hypothetical protein
MYVISVPITAFIFFVQSTNSRASVGCQDLSDNAGTEEVMSHFSMQILEQASSSGLLERECLAEDCHVIGTGIMAMNDPILIWTV